MTQRKKKKKKKKPVPRYRAGHWRIRWYDAHGARHGETYDTFDDASFALDRHLLKCEQVERGLRGLAIADRLFSELCDVWLKSRARQKRSGAADKSIIEAHWRPHFGKRTLREISIDLVNSFIEDQDHLSPKTIKSHLTLLIAMLNEAKQRGWVRDP